MKKRIPIFLLCLALLSALAAGWLLYSRTDTASALVSLGHIEEIKAEKAENSDVFLIVELAPSEEDGITGYYVSGQETTADWLSKAAAISGREERTAFVSGLFSDLQSRQLLGNGSSFPLTQDGDYTEYYPWEEHPAGALLLTLDRSEALQVRGTMTEQDGGDYAPNEVYYPDPNGTALQKVSRYEYAQSQTDGSYYYDLTFTPLPAGSVPADGTAVYHCVYTQSSRTDTTEETDRRLITEDADEIDLSTVTTVSEPITEQEGDSLITKTVTTTITRSLAREMVTVTDPETGLSSQQTDTYLVTTTRTAALTETKKADHYICVGIAGSGLSLNLAESYYTASVTPGTCPSASFTPDHPYRAVADGFVEVAAGSGLFSKTGSGWRYVGSGNGSYTFTADESAADTEAILTDTVYYTGGYTNNSWFLTDVLGCDSGDALPVLVRCFGPDDRSTAADLLAGADLIAVSSGADGTVPSLGQDILAAVESAADDGVPLLLDSGTAGLFRGSCASGLTDGGVNRNVYVCSEAALGASSFRLAIDGIHPAAADSPYFSVYSELVWENTLRSRSGTAALPLTVSPASCLRSILNYAGRRGENGKESLQVLDLEPMTSSAGLTAEAVLGWLPDGSFEADDIHITAMAASELAGSLADLCESYDLIYIGDREANTSALLDADFLYANIGCSVSIPEVMRGLTGSATARYSGNDLTEEGLQQLTDFAESGRPVILADSLVTPSAEALSYTFTATAAGAVSRAEDESDSGSAPIAALAAVCSPAPPDGVTLLYQWYRGTKPIAGADSDTLTFPADSTAAGTYYCVIRASCGSISASAASNGLTLKYSGGSYAFTSDHFEETMTLNLDGREGGITTRLVDNSSRWYDLLDSILERDNTFTAESAAGSQSRVLACACASRPVLTVSGDREYEEDDLSGSALTDRTLTASFTIENPTEALPASARYEACFYVDLDADGRFADSEQLTGLTIYDAGGSAVASGSLKAGQTYHIRYRLPDSCEGFLPWRLSVSKVGEAGARASATHYAYAAPEEPRQLLALQIIAGNQSVTEYDGSSGSLFRSGVIRSLVTVTESEACGNRMTIDLCGECSLDLFVLNMAEFNALAEGTADSAARQVMDTIAPGSSDLTLSRLLQQFDLLILGFGDQYGCFSADAAAAVSDFIGSGKAVLTSHDITSYQTGSSSEVWGTSFNRLCRDAVGLDRYGVTGTGLSAYETGWLPSAARTASVKLERQGFTRRLLNLCRSGGPENTDSVTTVTLANDGFLTRYPFRLGETISVSETHDQYYQLNLSSSDSTVWYCLGGSDIRNDGVNDYFAYSCGSVSYIGAGHTNSLTVDEGKLLINTLVSVCRSAADAPMLEFRRSDDSAVQTCLILTQDETSDESDESGSTLLYARPVHFKVNGAASGSYNQLSVEFWLTADDVTIPLPSPVLRRSSTQEAADSPESGVLYEFDLPDDVLALLSEAPQDAELKLYGRANAVIGSAVYTGTAACLDLQPTALMNLS